MVGSGGGGCWGGGGGEEIVAAVATTAATALDRDDVDERVDEDEPCELWLDDDSRRLGSVLAVAVAVAAIDCNNADCFISHGGLYSFVVVVVVVVMLFVGDGFLSDELSTDLADVSDVDMILSIIISSCRRRSHGAQY